jgi:phosphatidate cytidylyltransferase
VRHRLATAAVGAPLVLAAAWAGPGWFALLLGAVSALAIREFVRLGRLAGLGPAGMAAGCLLIPLLLASAVAVRSGPLGTSRAVGVLAAVWIADAAAFAVGRRWGRRRLAPRLSPRKTVEGLVAGVLAAAVLGAAGAPAVGLGRTEAAVGGLTLALAGVAGDLAESGLKRRAGVKDSGSLLPGHGGVLDRFDSLLLAAPVALALLRFAGP